MKDIHNHLLYTIDDGALSYQNSIEILKKLEIQGVTDIVVTPHYIIGTDYNSNNKNKLKLMESLKKKTKINLYIGNEVYLDNNIVEYIKNKEISTINNSRYLLVELPLNEKLECASRIIFDLRNNGIIPIIAHPERYHYLKLDDLVGLIELGCLFQGNITSLKNKYGKSARKNLELLLRKHMIHFIGTDTHRNVDNSLKKSINRLGKIVNKDMYNDLLENNFNYVVNNKEFKPYEIIKSNKIFRKEKIR